MRLTTFCGNASMNRTLLVLTLFAATAASADGGMLFVQSAVEHQAGKK